MLGQSCGMQLSRPPTLPANQAFIDQLFAARSVNRAGVVRRAIRDVEREVGRDAFIAEVRRRGFRLIESGDQFIVICNTGALRLLV
jgi:DNA-binding winged helix-turn-helix (wHTH) protein